MNNNVSKVVHQSFSAEAGIGLPVALSWSYKNKSGRYLPYTGDGLRNNKHNQYPQYLSRLVYESPTHGAAINRKSFMIKGQGIKTSDLTRTLQNLLKKVNNDFETINDIHAKISNDYAIFNGFAVEVQWSVSGTITEIYHIPFENVRIGSISNGIVQDYVISNDWTGRLNPDFVTTYSIKPYNKKVFDNIQRDELGIPVVTDEMVSNGKQLIYFKRYNSAAASGMIFYPVPDYISALDVIETEKMIHISNKSLLDNGFGGKILITFPFASADDTEKEEIFNSLIASFSGASKNGNIIAQFAPDKDSLPQVDKLESLSADTFVNVEKSVKQAIVTAHGIPSILLEMNEGGGFNNRAEEMKAAYDVFQKTKIKDYQNDLVRFYRSLFADYGFPDEEVQIIPFTLDDDTQQAEGNTSLQTQ